MKNYKMDLEDGVITYIEDQDAAGNPIPGILHIPEDAMTFSADAWVLLGSEADGITVHENNPVFSAAHNCLLSKSGDKLIKICKNSRVDLLTGVKIIGSGAFNTPNHYLDSATSQFVFSIPDGVETLDYRSFALAADRVEITVPASVTFVDLMAFMIHSSHTHIIFEGDPALQVGVFGTAEEAADSGFHVYRSLPAVLYPKRENITVTCRPDSAVAEYCKKYAIPTGA